MDLNSKYDQTYYSNNKLKKINDRWNQIQVGIDRDKQMRKQQIQEQLLTIDEKVTKTNLTFDLNIKQYKEKIREIMEVRNGEKSGRMRFQQKTDTQIRQIEENIMKNIENEKKNKQDLFQEWCKETDERLLGVCSNQQQQNYKNEQKLQNALVELKNKINGVETLILNERKKRQETTTEVTEHIQNQLNRIHNRIGIEKKVREETQSKLFKMIEDVQSKLIQEINSERNSRLQTKEALLRLLEETCHKVEVNFR